MGGESRRISECKLSPITSLRPLSHFFFDIISRDVDVRERISFEASVFASYDWPPIGAASGSFDARFFAFSLIQLSDNARRNFVPERFFSFHFLFSSRVRMLTSGDHSNGFAWRLEAFSKIRYSC